MYRGLLDSWLLENISIQFCVLGSFSVRDMKGSSKQPGAFDLASYLNPASLLNLTPEIPF